MKYFRKTVEKVLTEYNITLTEAIIIQLKSYASEFNNQNSLVIIKKF